MNLPEMRNRLQDRLKELNMRISHAEREQYPNLTRKKSIQNYKTQRNAVIARLERLVPKGVFS